MFLHGGLLHLLLNMLMLWMFGRELELVWGKRRFLNYFFLCGAGAGIIEVIVKTIPVFFGKPPSDIPTIGASGAIFGILIANAVLFPDRRIWLIPLPVTIPMRPYVAVMAAIEFFGTLGTVGAGAAHICPIGGTPYGYPCAPAVLPGAAFPPRPRDRPPWARLGCCAGALPRSAPSGGAFPLPAKTR